MKYIFKICWLFIFLSTGYSCKRTLKGEGPVISQTRDLNHATEIELSIPANVSLIESDSFSCVVGAQQNILEIIKTKSDGEEFTIESDRNFNIEKPVEIVIFMPKISSLTVNGSGVINGINSLHDKELNLEVNGSGTIKLNGKIINIKSEINGSGEIYLNGRSDQQKVEINGSGEFHGSGFESAQAKILITGSGDAEVYATEDLEAEITGSGNIRYKGNPHVKSDITGSGNVQKTD